MRGIESKAIATGESRASVAGPAHDLGNHLQIFASAMHLIERGLENDPDLLCLARCALRSVDRVGLLASQMERRDPAVRR